MQGETMASTRAVLRMPTTPERPDRWPVDDFVTTEEFVRRQGVQPIVSVDDLAAVEDPFEPEQEYAHFLADLCASRPDFGHWP